MKNATTFFALPFTSHGPYLSVQKSMWLFFFLPSSFGGGARPASSAAFFSALSFLSRFFCALFLASAFARASGLHSFAKMQAQQAQQWMRSQGLGFFDSTLRCQEMMTVGYQVMTKM